MSRAGYENAGIENKDLETEFENIMIISKISKCRKKNFRYISDSFDIFKILPLYKFK